MTVPSGLRERKKAATRAALGFAALRLAIEHGSLDRVSADQIASEAGVSTRTFHNYFRSKEEAVLNDFNEFARAFLDDVRERARRQPVWDALRDASIGLHVDERFELTMMRCREELVKNSPTLITEQAGKFIELFTAALDIVAEATGSDSDDLYPRLVLGSALIAMKVANEHWLQHPEDAPLSEVLTQTFAQFEAGITRPTTE